MKPDRQWLFDTAKQLVAISTSSSDCHPDPALLHKIYDQCLWEALTANVAQLSAVYDQDWAFDLPVPIHTVICQRLAMLSGNRDVAEKASAFALMYAGPGEEENMFMGLFPKQLS